MVWSATSLAHQWRIFIFVGFVVVLCVNCRRQGFVDAVVFEPLVIVGFPRQAAGFAW